MYRRKWAKVVSGIGQTFDRKVLLGVMLGGCIVMAGYAVSQTAGLSTTLGSSSSTLISQETSVVADSITQDAQKCAEGTTPGTIGNSIQTALKIHTEIASATPAVETLFDASESCFAGISQLFDLSFSIPSLQSILASAQSAVTQYATKKVCTAVNQVSSMVTSPINASIGKVNSLISTANDLNGLTNGLVQQGLTQVDPDLGSSYHKAAGGNYTVNTNAFSASQTQFSSDNTDSQLNSQSGQINNLTNQIANVQAQLGPAQSNYQQAQQNYQSCQGSGEGGDCSSYFNALQQATQTYTQLQQQLISLQQQMSNVVTTQSSTTQSSQSQSSVAGTNTKTDSSAQKTGGSWWSSVTSVFGG